MNEVVPFSKSVQVDLTKPLTDLDAAWRVATVMAQSNLVPYALQGSASNCLLVMLMGADLGLNPAQAVRTIYVPTSGRPQLTVELMLALVRQQGHDYEFEHGEESCTFKLIRDSGKEYTATFTLQDALRARLIVEKNGEYVALSPKGAPMPWMLYQPDMLFARAASRAVKRGAPEVVLGFGLVGVDTEVAEPVVLAPAAVAEQTANVPEGQNSQATAASQADVVAELRDIETAVQDQPAVPDEQAAKAAEPAKLLQQEEAATIQEPATGAQPPEALFPATDEPQATQKQQKQLAEKFTAVGWPPAKYAADILNACTAFCRRPIWNAAMLTQKEATALAAELGRIQRNYEPDFQTAALADQVQVWLEAADNAASDG